MVGPSASVAPVAPVDGAGGGGAILYSAALSGPTAQAVALTCYANAAIRGIAAPAFTPAHSTAQFCERITFAAARRTWWGGRRTAAVAQDPAAWFEALRREGRTAVLLHYRASRNDVAVAGGAQREYERVSDALHGALVAAIAAAANSTSRRT